MPNWCSVGYTFYADTEKGRTNLRKLYKKLSTLHDNNNYAGFRELLELCGVGNPDIEKLGVDIRDTVTSVDETIFYFYDYLIFSIRADTAWSNHNATKALCYLLKRCFKGVQFAYIAEECGSDYYVKYDPIGCYSERYVVDITGSDAPLVDIGYLETKKDIFSYAEELGVKGLNEGYTLEQMCESIKSELISQAIDRGVEKPDVNVFINEYEELMFDDCGTKDLEEG